MGNQNSGNYPTFWNNGSSNGSHNYPTAWEGGESWLRQEKHENMNTDYPVAWNWNWNKNAEANGETPSNGIEAPVNNGCGYDSSERMSPRRMRKTTTVMEEDFEDEDLNYDANGCGEGRMKVYADEY